MGHFGALMRNRSTLESHNGESPPNSHCPSVKREGGTPGADRSTGESARGLPAQYKHNPYLNSSEGWGGVTVSSWIVSKTFCVLLKNEALAGTIRPASAFVLNNSFLVIGKRLLLTVVIL